MRTASEEEADELLAMPHARVHQSNSTFAFAANPATSIPALITTNSNPASEKPTTSTAMSASLNPAATRPPPAPLPRAPPPLPSSGLHNHHRYEVPPPPHSLSLDLNKLPLKFMDEDREERRTRRRRRRGKRLPDKQQQSTSSLTALSADAGAFDDDDDEPDSSSFGSEDSEEEDASLDLIRLSVIQPVNGATDSLRDERYTLDSQSGDDGRLEGERFCFAGWVRLSVTGKKQPKKCWLTLRGEDLSFFEDDTQDEAFIGPLDMSRLRFIGLLNKDTIHVVVLERRRANEKSSSAYGEYKFSPLENQEFWMQMLTRASCQGQKVLRANIQSASAGGRIWLKQTLIDEWSEGWAFVAGRTLRYFMPALNEDSLFEVDLRRTIELKMDLNTDCWCPRAGRSDIGPLLISADGSSLYMQSDMDSCTLLWYKALMELFQSATRLDEHLLTASGIPLLVDICIRYIQIHGLELQGIYRKSGSAAKVRSLMDDFRNHPFTFDIMRENDDTSHAAAEILKKFLRESAEPLIPREKQSTLYHISKTNNAEARVEAYRCTLAQFPPVNGSTLRRLVCHLAEVAERADRNLMSIDNLATVFGPTVFASAVSDFRAQTSVVRDLLTHYKEIFPLSVREMAVKERIEELQSRKMIPKARANGLLVAVHLLEKDNMSFNVQSHWQAAQVIDFKAKQLANSSGSSNSNRENGGSNGTSGVSESYALFEVLVHGRLERRVAHDEVLKHIVDRWLEWRNVFPDHYLVLKRDLGTIDSKNTNAFADDVKYAAPGAKTFKTVVFKLESGTWVVCYSNTKEMKELDRWRLASTIWFMGSMEEQRAPNPHTLTFFGRSERERRKEKERSALGVGAAKSLLIKGRGGGGGGGGKERGAHELRNSKCPGACIAFRSEEQRTQWLNCVLICKRECPNLVMAGSAGGGGGA